MAKSKPGASLSGLHTAIRVFVGALSRALPAILAAVLVPAAGHAQADKFPTTAVKIVVPFPAGGPTDLGARIVADSLQAKWGQPVFVENKPGGGSVIGTAAVANASPDGYTLLFGPSSALIENKFLLQGGIPYDPVKSFTPITEAYKMLSVLGVSSKLSVNTPAELVALAKTKALNYSSFGIGSGPHLLLETFKRAAGVEITHVVYRGNSEGVLAVVSGQVDVTGSGPGTIRPYAESGQMKMLAIAADARYDYVPDVPTFSELGYPTVGGGSLFIGVWGPHGMAPDLAAKINRDVAEAIDGEKFSKFLKDIALVKPTARTPAALEQLVQSSLNQWGPILTSLVPNKAN